MSCTQYEPLKQHCKISSSHRLETGSLYLARSVEEVSSAQDGGVVTCLLGYALDTGLIKSAVVARKDDCWNPSPVIVTDSSELKNYAGSIYFPLDNRDLRAKVRKAVDAHKDVGIVATPCELSVLGLGSNAVKSEEVYLKVGLFCLGSFNPEKFWNYVGDEIKREDVKRFEIGRDIRLIDREGRTAFRRPVREAHKYSIPWCKKCQEFVPAKADLSIGAGPRRGTCAVYLQTPRGMEVFKRAYEDNALIVEDISVEFRERFDKTIWQKGKKPTG
jgi:coenzyme F420-reducing hydrogenase beta subunit